MSYTLTIDRYLDGTLSREEYSEFRKQVLSDPKFEKRVEKYERTDRFIREEYDKGIRKGIPFDNDVMEFVDPNELKTDIDMYQEKNEMQESDGIIAFRKRLDGFHQEMLSNQKIIDESNDLLISKRVPKKLKWYMAAAAIAIIIASGSLLFFKGHQGLYSNDELYNAYYQSSTNEIEFGRGVINKKTEIFNKALDKYNRGEFTEAQLLFKQIVNDPAYVASYFYLGRSYMQTQNFKEAVSAFKHYTENDIFIGYADWYLGLCYLKLNDRKSAAGYFEKTMIIGSRDYKEKAKEILKKLK
jgi:tetratricopeptide (TPR) repeat protein